MFARKNHLPVLLSNKCPFHFIEEAENNLMAENNDEEQKEDLELPFFDLSTIANATDDFSINKKLGQGGFGAVYRVIMLCIG